MPPEQLLGPLGLVVASLIAVGVLAREVKRAWDGRLAAEQARADRAEAREQVALDGWRAQSTANEHAVKASNDLTGAVTRLLER